MFVLFQNIELKVEVESLKQELQEKQQLLDKALYVHLPDQSTYISTLALCCLCGCGNERDGCDGFNSWLSDLLILVPV